VRTAALFRWIVAAIVVMEAGFVSGYVSGRLPSVRLPATPPARTAQTGARSSRLGRTARPATPTPSPSPSPTPVTGSTTSTTTIQVGGANRQYEVIRPLQPVSPRVPALVILHGVNSTVDNEVHRDGLLPVANAGQAVLVYPVGYGQSWNAGVCCPPANQAGVDDVGFIDAVLQQISADPGVDSGRVTLVGFSNGGRMAYQVDCAQPGVVTSMVAVLAVPVSPCSTSTPVSLLEIATADDPEVPYGAGAGSDVGLTAVTDETAAWRSRDGCADGVTSQTTQGQVTSAVWSECQEASQVQLATYASGGHEWQNGDATTPSMQRLIWSFAVAGPGLPDPLSQ
jgi:polyhydroxybutyrate depolymerase